VVRHLATRPLRWALEIAGRVYVPGHRLDDALHVARKLAPSGLASTLGYFQSAEDPPQTVEDMTLAIVEAVAKLTPPGYVSIKAPALGYDPKLITAIAAKAKERGILAHFDSHELHTADLTLGCVRQSVALGARSGLTLPGRWRRSLGGC
jgi:proline dehydrogenase